MKTSLNGALAALACLGMIAQPALAAGPAVAAAPTVANVKLTDAGVLKGRVADGNGRPMAEQTVNLVKAGHAVAQVKTNAEGAFAMAKIVPGSYVLSVGQKAADVRVWDAVAAPPQSMNEALLLAGDAPVRGQYCENGCPPGGCQCGGGGGGFFGGLDFITLATVGAAVTAAVLAGVAVSEANDTNDSIAQFEERFDDLDDRLDNIAGTVSP